MEEEEDIIEKTDNQLQIKQPKITPLLPYQFKKGQSGNPAGRPKGKSLKEYTRDMIAAMTDDERQNFLHGIPKKEIWAMSEGNPDTKTDMKLTGTIDMNEEDQNKLEAFKQWHKTQTKKI